MSNIYLDVSKEEYTFRRLQKDVGEIRKGFRRRNITGVVRVYFTKRSTEKRIFQKS